MSCQKCKGSTTHISVRARCGSSGTGKLIAQIAEDLAIHPGTLGNWVKKDRIERGESEGPTVDERAPLAQREKENATSATARRSTTHR